jgi:UDPglucose 6-dehydrogenase
MEITVIGVGYVGLVTAACLADLGHDVTCLDTDRDKIARLNAGQIPIFEPGLEGLVSRARATERIRFFSDYSDGIPGAKLVFIAVGTPASRNGKADLTAVVEATKSAAKLIEPNTTLVVKSTVPVGTTMDLAGRIADIRPDVPFEVAANPEFLRQGSAVDDFMRPDRIVIGVRTEAAADTLRKVYQPILNTGVPGIFTNLETAELIKYASNAFLAVKLSFINEMADVCEEAGGYIHDLTLALGLDPRIGEHFLSPGPGYGGSCLPKDTQALLHTTRIVGAPSRVVAAAIDVNANRRSRMAEKIASATGGSVQGKNVAVLGLTFKANTDDLRESPAVEIIRGLIGEGANVRAYDPEGMEAARHRTERIEFAADPYQCVEGADVVAILTEWAEFATLDLERVKALVAEPVIVDLRNLYDPTDMERAGFVYYSIGR